jgi:hypothetical protein
MRRVELGFAEREVHWHDDQQSLSLAQTQTTSAVLEAATVDRHLKAEVSALLVRFEDGENL